MKNIKHYLFAAIALVAGLTFAACGEDPTVEPKPEPQPEQEVSANVDIASIEQIQASLKVTTQGMADFAYLMSDKEVVASAIFGGGTKVAIEDMNVSTENVVELDDLEPNTAYSVYFAFHTYKGEIYEDVIKVDFVTTNFGQALTVVETMYDGFKVHINIPEEVQKAGNAIRYSTTSLPMYNYQIMREVIEADMLLTNAGQYTTESKTIIYDEYHSVERDENGNEIYDENGNYASATYADPKTPGEPGIFMAGEFSWYHLQDPDPETGETDSGPYGWGEGYYVAEFDWAKWYAEWDTDAYDRESYWTGYYERIQVDCIAPEKLEGNVEIKVTDKTPIDALIRFIPSDDVMFYIVFLVEESEYEATVLPLLDNNTDYLQWFTASYWAMYSYGTQTVAGGNSELYLTDWFVDTKGMAGKTIRVMVTGMGDNDGHVQCFNTTTFQLPEVTLPAPEIEINAVESDDPYSVTFNIRATNQPITEAYFACNYVREFNTILKEYSYLTLLQSMGNKFGSAEVDAINSEKGFNMTLSSRENATTRLAVLAYNWEGTGNNPNETGSKAVCEYTTPRANYPTRVNSPLFDELVGEWEASAPMKSYSLNDDNTYDIKDAGTYTSDVTICGRVDYPETLPEEVIDIYANAGVSRGDTEALFEEFKQLADEYNSRTRGFNRLLCLGYDFADPAYRLDVVQTPWDLFKSEEFSFTIVSDIFYDFGPKWNLEIDADGSVWLPIDIEREYPMSTFFYGMDYAFYMLGVGQYSYFGGPIYGENGKVILDARFPVEVSDDRNTITIKPIVYTDSTGKTETYYPCVAQLQYGMASPINPRVEGDIVLKRKGASTSAVKSNASVGDAKAAPVRSLGKTPTPKARPYSMTPMDISKIVTYERIAPKTKIESGVDAFHERTEAYLEKAYGIKFK